MRKNLLLMLLGSAHSLNHSLFLILPPLLGRVVVDIGASIDVIGIIMTLSGLIYGTGALLGGSLSDRIGEGRIIALSLFFSGISTYALFIAQDIIAFGFGFLIMSAWASLYHPAANNLISKVFYEDMASKMGIHGVGGNVGFMLTPSIAVILGISFSWRVPFLLFGSLSIITSIFFLGIQNNLGMRDSEEAKSDIKVASLLKNPDMRFILIFSVVSSLYAQGVTLLLPLFLNEEKEISEILAGHVASAILLIGIFGQYLGGKASAKIGSKMVLLLSSVGVSVALFSLLLIPYPIISIFMFISVYGISVYMQQPALTSVIGLRVPASLRGMAYGFLFFFGWLGSISTTVAGYLAEEHGLEFAFYILAIFSLISLVLSLLIPSESKRVI